MQKDGVPVLCICLNAAFSGSIQSAMNAKNQILEGLSGSTDRGCGFGGSDGTAGMFVEEACRLRGAELDMKEAVKLLEEIRPTGRIFLQRTIWIICSMAAELAERRRQSAMY